MSANGGILKQINKYLNQAKKLDKIEPVIAYYCRLYAVQYGMKMKKTKEDNLVINELMSWCEKHGDIVRDISRDDRRAYCEAFALRVFDSADVDDRSGNITKQTAVKFNSAYIFIDICRQFGELASDLDQKIKYSMWKVTDITKALKEGRTPIPGGIEEQRQEENSFPPSIEAAAPASASTTNLSSSFSSLGGFGSELGRSGSYEDSKSDNFAYSSSPSSSSFPSLATSPQPFPSSTVSTSTSVSSSEEFSLAAAAAVAAKFASLQPTTQNEQIYNDQNDKQEEKKHEQNHFQSSQTSSIAASTSALSPSSSQFNSNQSINLSTSNSSSSPTQSLPSNYHSGLSIPSTNNYTVAPLNLPSNSPLPLPHQSSLTITPVIGKSRIESVKEAERLIKHATSALNFDDINTTIMKLQQAVAVLYNHK